MLWRTNGGGARVGKLRRQVGQDAQRPFQGAEGQEAGVGDERSLVEGDFQRWPAYRPQGKGSLLLGAQDREPPHVSKLLVQHSLDTARGSPCLRTVRNPG